MMSFSEFISEGKYPKWVRLSVGTLVLRINNLAKQIEKEKDPINQNKLISQQNKLQSYISGLGIGVGTEDKILLQRLKTFKTKV
jgi:heme exporter protein D